MPSWITAILPLTTTVYIDFGLGVDAAGISSTLGGYKDIVGAGQAPEMMLLFPPGIDPAKDLALKKLTFDEGGAVKYTTDAQLKALQDQVVELVKHIFEPFDIEVKADSIEKLLKKNNSDPTGHNDAYVLGGNFLPSARPGKYSVTWGRHGPGT
jgi:hypothetical protein